MLCRATGCPETAITSGLCEGHYREWIETLNSKKSIPVISQELKEKYLKPSKFTNLGDFAP